MPIQDKLAIELIDRAKKFAASLDLNCQFLDHPHIDGRTSEGAAKALGVDVSQIIKCLFLKSKKKRLFFAIVRGDTKLSMKKLEMATGEKKFSLVAKDEVFALTNFFLGGIPPFIGILLNIPIYIDELVFSSEYVYGSGGSPYVGLRFKPTDLTEKGAFAADLIY